MGFKIGTDTGSAETSLLNDMLSHHQVLFSKPPFRLGTCSVMVFVKRKTNKPGCNFQLRCAM
jgi:hypothetical protein